MLTFISLSISYLQFSENFVKIVVRIMGELGVQLFGDEE